MVVREHREADLAEIARLYYDTVHFVNAKDYTQKQIEAWAPGVYDKSFWRERFKKYKIYVAQDKAVIVGFAEFENTGHIDCFYVHHNWQRKGVGSRLLEHIEKEAKEHNILRLFAEVSLTALPFFRASGFTMIREQEKEYRGMLFKQFFMEKWLEYR